MPNSMSLHSLSSFDSFGNLLKYLRRRARLSQRDLSIAVGYSESQISRFESNQRPPDLPTLAARFAPALQIEVEPETVARLLELAAAARGGTAPALETSATTTQPTSMDAVADFQTGNGADSVNNLPFQLTSFVGREREIAEVQRLFTTNRLTTLTGAGGCGKTRLALEVAHAVLKAFPDGVWFIEFAPLANLELLPQTVASVLGLREGASGSILGTLTNHLRAKTALLIFDNCEHLIEACAELAEALLRACPHLKILATSREALGLLGETAFLVPPLSLPHGLEALSVETVTQSEALQLFVERARAVQPDFQLTDVTVSTAAQICQQLDGLPLAIELAAARVRALSVAQIAARLEDRFRLLAGGNRTALPRHQTLSALIDWSYELLPEMERALLRRLSVFRGGWTLEAAEAVCAGGELEATLVLGLLMRLVDKSLVVIEEQGQAMRYGMLETIRQYARERLLESGDAERIQNRHLEFFLQWAEQVEPEVHGPRQLEWLNRVEAEHDSLRAALEWSLAQAEGGEASLRLAGALFSFWSQRGHVSEGRAWLARALASPAARSTGAARAKALYAAGFLAHWEKIDQTTGKALLEESVGLWRALGPAGKSGLAHTLVALGEVMRGQGDPATARSLASEAIALFREQDERWGLAYSLSNLGLAIRDQGDFALARSVINESLALWRDLGDLWGLGVATRFLGMVALRQGDYEVARRHYADFLAIARKLGDENGVADAFLDLGTATLNLGDRVRAKSFFEEGFRLLRESGNKTGLAISFYYLGYFAHFEGHNQQAKSFFEQELALARTVGPICFGANALLGMAGVAAATGQARRAARLLGAAEARLEAGASYWNAAESLHLEHTRASAEAQLGEAAFADARAEGRAMTFEQAADYALEE